MSVDHSPHATPVEIREKTLLTYIADLELEVDRLRRQLDFLYHSTADTARKVNFLCSEPAERTPDALLQIQASIQDLRETLHDLRETGGFHPAHDHVVPIAIRPLLEQVLRWHQRILNMPQVALRLDLEENHVEWFPARLRHILDNLVANALGGAGAVQGEIRVSLAVRETASMYEFRLTSNGPGQQARATDALALFHRSSPARSANLQVSLAVVKVLVEQSGGTTEFHSGDDQCTSCVITLPRFDLHDHL